VVLDINDDEVEFETIREEPKEHMPVEERMIREISGIGGKHRIGTPVYSRSLSLEELIHWIGQMEKFFGFE